jgi:Methyltransferase FkbM domain
MLLKDDVIFVYQTFLAREPENEDVVIEAMGSFSSRDAYIEAVKESAEYKLKSGLNDNTPPLGQNPYWHFASDFDAVGTIKKYAKTDIQPSPNHTTNFLGVKIRPAFLPEILGEKIGTVEAAPMPNNWHADIAEWASCLRAVELSGDRFSMLELGCGWGCWMSILGVTAKKAGKKIKLYGIEADDGHLDFARLAFVDNEIQDNEFELSYGIAGKSSSIAMFPIIKSGVNWGGEAIFNPTNTQLIKAMTGAYKRIPVIDITKLLINEDKLDLLHVDIQGAELDLLQEIFELLCKKVSCVLIGTHSKQIEGGLFTLFMKDNRWKLEMERPAIFKIINGHPQLTVDGVQAWRNAKLS